ncbi:MAG: amidohydrolase [Propionibacteriaceae bacterium]|jgi:amidohydrolase|uniref:Amidohydrolase n=1 Tax=Brooklawnia propionicigenes TaxID=3041175 RepID=A0AAN0K986_9ACTN|nr:M20 family metallopeptidase [Brooklawnia sp. SH051]MCB0883930.1 amidohydrolase [Propionibacteriaceae bacterium]NLI85816.1 amidohydrolase [Propionibacterium sp.]BEH03231.1 amidohydrolase [Brooklawnia sp. SH051]
MSVFFEQLRAQQEYLTGLRRAFHQHPELALHEFWTAEAIERELDLYGIPHRRVGATGVLGTLTGDLGGDRVIALRADIDGLPVQETNDVPYRSQIDGVMHACGHDSHITCLLGAAKTLKSARGAFGGTVKLIFQPGEEVGLGALDFVEAGVLDDAGRTFGLHAASDLLTGSVAAVPGLNCAAVDHFGITVHGKGAHVSRPQLGADALYVAASLVTQIQAIVTRRTNPVEPVVIGVGKLHAGTTYNALAETAELEGTTRTVTPESRILVRQQITHLAEQTAEAFGATVEVQWREFTPAVVNPPAITEEVAEIARRIDDNIQVITQRPISLGGDNFADLALRVPGVYAFLGTGNPAVANTQNSHHNGNFDLDEAALPIGAALYADYAFWWLTAGAAAL